MLSKKEKRNIDNLWNNVEIGNEDECWIWKGKLLSKNGYGVCSQIGGYISVNRAIYFLEHNEKIPPQYQVKPICENKLCCNPKHLFLVKHGEKLNYDSKFKDMVWSHIDIKSEDECWEWTAHRSRDGYGRTQYSHNGVIKSIQPHRFIYELYHGEIPENMEILHSCDNPPCCNPKHLRVGAHAENVKELWKRGRQNPRSNLNEKNIFELVDKYNNEHISIKELAKLYDVGYSSIKNIIMGKTWKHLNLKINNREITIKMRKERAMEILYLYNNSNFTINELCEKYNMSESGIKLIISRKRWMNITI